MHSTAETQQSRTETRSLQSSVSVFRAKRESRHQQVKEFLHEYYNCMKGCLHKDDQQEEQHETRREERLYEDCRREKRYVCLHSRQCQLFLVKPA